MKKVMWIFGALIALFAYTVVCDVSPPQSAQNDVTIAAATINPDIGMNFQADATVVNFNNNAAQIEELANVEGSPGVWQNANMISMVEANINEEAVTIGESMNCQTLSINYTGIAGEKDTGQAIAVSTTINNANGMNQMMQATENQAIEVVLLC